MTEHRDGQWYGASHNQVIATERVRVRTATQSYREGGAPWSNLTERERARYYGRPQRDNVGERAARRECRAGKSTDDHEMVSAAIGATSARGYLSRRRPSPTVPVPTTPPVVDKPVPTTPPVVDKARAAANRLRQVESFARDMARHPRERWGSYARNNVPVSIREAVIVAAGIYSEVHA